MAPGGGRTRRGVALDVAYSYLVPVIIYPAIYGTILLLHQMPDARGPLGQLGFATQVVLAVVVGEFVAYWKHRLLHTRLLWPFHAAHHSSVEVDWLSNERVHPVESLINAPLQAGTLVLVGFAPATIGLAVAIRQVYSAFTHANVRLSYGPLKWLLVSPHHHRWHPSDDPAMAGRNFANMLAVLDVLDVLGGTWNVPQRSRSRSASGASRCRRGSYGRWSRRSGASCGRRRPETITPPTPATPCQRRRAQPDRRAPARATIVA